eukprot:6350542-Amphidinium_carterae.1
MDLRFCYTRFEGFGGVVRDGGFSKLHGSGTSVLQVVLASSSGLKHGPNAESSYYACYSSWTYVTELCLVGGNLCGSASLLWHNGPSSKHCLSKVEVWS